MNDAISIQESARLVKLETIIERGLPSFREVGAALLEIRDSRLYRIEYKTFENYCDKKWDMTMRFARMKIAGAKAVAALTNGNHGSTLPSTERQARPLTTLGTPEQQREAWQDAVEASGGKPTAKDVKEAVEVLRARTSDDKPPKAAPSRGIAIAEKAISELKRIKANDTERKAAARLVLNWIKKNLK